MKESRNLKKTIERSLSIIVSILLSINLLAVSVLIYLDSQSEYVFANSRLVEPEVTEVTVAPKESLDVEVCQEVDTESESKPEPAPKSETTYIDLTQDEKYQLACLIWLESRGEPIECQYGVGSVVINRFTTGDYDSILDVIYEEDQFSPASFIDSTTPGQTQLDIVEDLCKNGPTMPEYVTYFRADYYHEWTNHTEYTQIGQTYFSYDNDLYAEVN